MLLTPQLEYFPSKPPSTLYMGRCQFSYKAFGLPFSSNTGHEIKHKKNCTHIVYKQNIFNYIKVFVIKVFFLICRYRYSRDEISISKMPPPLHHLYLPISKT